MQDGEIQSGYPSPASAAAKMLVLVSFHLRWESETSTFSRISRCPDVARADLAVGQDPELCHAAGYPPAAPPVQQRRGQLASRAKAPGPPFVFRWASLLPWRESLLETKRQSL